MTYSGLTVEYMVHKATDPPFPPGNVQAPTNSHDNPDNGTDAERVAGCLKLSPDAVVVQATGGIASASTISEGSGYTEGAYNNVPVTGGSGTGATLDCQYLSGSWAFIIFQDGGTGYKVGDTVSVDPANVGGTGSGLSMHIDTVF
jgi:hypothetical protein